MPVNHPWRALALSLSLGLTVALSACAGGSWFGMVDDESTMRGGNLKLKPVAYRDLAGWRADDHAAAYRALRRSCEKLIDNAGRGAAKGGDRAQALLAVCQSAAQQARLGRDGARAFFEKNFTPHEITVARPDGLLTAYYEPVLEGSRKRSKGYDVPIYRRPDDLMLLSSPEERGTRNAEITAVRKTANGNEPYPTRRQIEEGALKGRGLELLYLKDPVDAYFMHIQGSARIRLNDGQAVRVGFAAKNGYPYTSIGKALIAEGAIDAASMSMQKLKAWLRANPEKAKKVMWQNRSFIFFRELGPAVGSDGPIGAQGVSLSAGRSLAVDTGFHALGTPIWLSVPGYKRNDRNFPRLMIAQDVGSAIQGPERGDVYWGSGDKAGRAAGRFKYPGSFIVFVPNVQVYQ